MINLLHTAMETLQQLQFSLYSRHFYSLSCLQVHVGPRHSLEILLEIRSSPDEALGHVEPMAGCRGKQTKHIGTRQGKALENIRYTMIYTDMMRYYII